jgi:hypothetical protein
MPPMVNQEAEKEMENNKRVKKKRKNFLRIYQNWEHETPMQENHHNELP